MLIVDAQIHLWEKGTPSPQHRQEPYSAEQAIAAMDQAGVDRALIHPVLWDPDSNELAIEAVRKYPNRFAIMGGSISTTRMVATSLRVGKSGRACSACASISTSGTSGSG
jgi:predicted TIM-barrel fold metal-dependent hydrolase